MTSIMQTAALVDDYLKARKPQLSASTYKETARVLGNFAAACPELPQRPDPIFKWLGTVGNTVSSRNAVRKTLSTFYTWASSRDGIGNPMPQVKVPQRRAKSSHKEARQVGATAHVYEHGGGHTSTVDPVLVEAIARRVVALSSRPLSDNQTGPAPSAEARSIPTAQAVTDFLYELEHGAKPKKQATLGWYQRPLSKLAARYEILPMDGSELDHFIGTAESDGLHHVYSRVLIYFYKTLGKLYHWRRLGIVNPVEEISRVMPDNEEVIPLQADELEKLLGVLRLEQDDIRAMMLLLVTTGVRPVEVVTLKTTDFYGSQIRVSGKTKPRMVTLLPPLQVLLGSLHPVSASPGPVFACVQESFESQGVLRRVEKVMQAASVRGGKGGGRLFRHTFACWLYSETNDPFLVQQVLGHTKLEMSRHYAKMRMPRTAEAPLWYELIKAATASHKLEIPRISPELEALIKGQQYQPTPVHRELSHTFQQQYGPAEKRRSHHAPRRPTLVQLTMDKFLEGTHGATEEPARN